VLVEEEGETEALSVEAEADEDEDEDEEDDDEEESEDGVGDALATDMLTSVRARGAGMGTTAATYQHTQHDDRLLFPEQSTKQRSRESPVQT
jgi:hypothetical protein